MCTDCFEGFGLSYASAVLHGREPPADFCTYFNFPVLVQEGVADRLPNLDLPRTPLSRWCLQTEKVLLAGGKVLVKRPVNSAVVGSWQPAGSLAEADDGCVTGALDVLDRYLVRGRWLAAEQRKPPVLVFGPKQPTPVALTDEKLGLFFPSLWVAWMVAARAPASARAEIAQGIAACPYFEPTDDELLSLFLARRAVLTWYDLRGMEPLLLAYNISLQPRLAHYVAMRRSLSDADTARLRIEADRHGEGGALAGLLT